MDVLHRIFNVLILVGFVWMIGVGGLTLLADIGNTTFSQRILLTFVFGVVPVILLLLIRKIIVYIIIGRK